MRVALEALLSVSVVGAANALRIFLLDIFGRFWNSAKRFDCACSAGV